MRKVIAAVLPAGAMLVACTLYVSEDATRIRPDAGPGDGPLGTRDGGLIDGGVPGDGRPHHDGGVPDDGPLVGDGGTLDGGPPGLDGGALDGGSPGTDGGVPGDGRPYGDGSVP